MRDDRSAGSRGTWAAPLLVLAVGAAFVAATWWHFEQRENADAARRLGLLAEQVAARLEAVVDTRLALVVHLRRRWTHADSMGENRWHVVARQVQIDFSGFQSLNWVDADGRILWVEPIEGNEAAQGVDLTAHPVVGPLFRESTWPREGRVSPPIDLVQGGRGFVLYVPVGPLEKPRGWVSGVFRVDDLLDTCLPEGPPLGHVLLVTDLDSGGSLAILGGGSEAADWASAARATLSVGERRWGLDIAPTPAAAGRQGSPADEIFAAVGLLLLIVAVLLLRHVLERGRQLEESRSRYRSLVESAPEAIVVLDVQSGLFVDANSRAEELFRRSRDELLALGPAEVSPPFAPDGRPAAEVARERILQAMAGGEPVFEWTHVDAEGRPVPCEVRLRRLGEESPPRIRGTMVDIRARKEAERALRESERKYRRIVDTAHEGVWLIDAEGRTTFVNSRMAEILGGTAEEILGRSMYDFMEDDDRAQAESNLDRRRDGVEEMHEFRFRRLDGSHVWTMLATNPVTDDEGRFVGALAMVADVTQQRELEQALRQSQKMEAVGRLAGGIAHDFNNIVTGILGAADLLAREATDRPEAMELVDEIRSAGERAGALTRQLLAFSRRQVVQPELVDLRATLRGMRPVLSRLIGERHELDFRLGEGPAVVLADPAQLEQVVLNLVVNARDARPEGGPVRVRLASEADSVVLEVEDEGPGVPQELRDRIFEPFFTTKEDSGTGLGLSTVHGIVAGAGGSVRVGDAAGGGALFRVTLPAQSGASIRVDAAPRASAPDGRLRILLVDDEGAVRRVVRQTLVEAGHEVVDLESPQSALGLLGDESESFDLLLTDLRMPGLSGRELAERAVALRPGIGLVVMTGFTDEAVRIDGHDEVVVLQKPFRSAELLEAVALAVRPGR